MSGWNVAAAQSGSRPGDIDWNIQHHLEFVLHAAARRVDLLIFPELSLTGYELALMAEKALSPDDARLQVFADAAVEHRMGIVIGLPLRSEGSLQLSSMSFLADGTRLIYSKRHLYGAEQQIFRPGAAAMVSGEQPHRVAQAICADISVGPFAEEAADLGADLYATSVLVSNQGYQQDAAYLARWSREYGMAVLMANHAWPTGGFSSAGKSAFWAPDGQQVIQAGTGEQLVIARREGNHWQGEVHPLPCGSGL